MNYNILYIITTIFLLYFIIIRFLNYSKFKKCTKCNVWNHVDIRSKCERICKENNLTYTNISNKSKKDLHCECV